MLIPNQMIEVKWHPPTRQHYINKGYIYTKMGDTFMAKAEDLPPTSKIPVRAICDYCGQEFSIWIGRYNLAISEPIGKCCCEKCKGKKLSDALQLKHTEGHYNEFLQLCENYGFTPISQMKDCTHIENILEYSCPVHGLQKKSLLYLRKNGCEECKKDLARKKFSASAYLTFLSLCEERGYTPLSTIDEIQNESSWARYLCPKHGEQRIHIKDLKLGHGCIQCRHDYMADLLRMPIEDVISVIESKNGNKLLNPNEYTRAIDNNLKIKCGSCGNIFTCSLNNYQKLYDGKCSECHERSIGEIMIHDILHKYNIPHIQQHSFPDCKHIHVLLFDFYLPENNVAIEFDGIYHFEPIHGEESLKMTQLRDSIKNKYCENNNIKMIRIPYWEIKNLEQIVISELNIRINNVEDIV